MENASGHGKVMEHEKIAKKKGMEYSASVMGFYQFCPKYYQMCAFLRTEVSNGSESQHFRPYRRNVSNAKFEQRDGYEKSRNHYGNVMGIFFQCLWEPCRMMNTCFFVLLTLQCSATY